MLAYHYVQMLKVLKFVLFSDVDESVRGRNDETE